MHETSLSAKTTAAKKIVLCQELQPQKIQFLKPWRIEDSKEWAEKKHLARLGMARLSLDRLGSAWFGLAQIGPARHGSSRLGWARLGPEPRFFCKTTAPPLLIGHSHIIYIYIYIYIYINHDQPPMVAIILNTG